MKKLFSFIACALFSVAMIAGENDLLWDYSEAKIPTSGPDRGLYYGAYVNDAPSTNLGLNGVKMNSSGYAYFTKAAVAGKLKLTFSPRKSGNTLKLAVWTWTGETPAAQTLIKETATVGDLVTEIIDLTAEQTNIYITRPSGTGEGVLQKIQFVEDVARTFVDFEMIMCNMTQEYDFTTLPSGVTASGTFNSDQHGYRNFTITIPVDGTVKFTIGDCQYGNQPIAVKNNAGETIATLTYPAAGCYGPNTTDKVFPYIYMGEADVLTFGPIQYCNYFKAEAADITPCAITFKDQNGNVLGKVDTYEGATLDTLPDVSMLPEYCDMCFFRGWFYSNNKKAKIGDPINGNTTIQARVTPYETATVGSVQTYNFADVTFYPEDHETVEVHGGAFHDAAHGWYFTGNESMFDNLGDIKGVINVSVAGKAVIVISACKYSENGTIEIPADEEKQWPGASFTVEKEVTPDGTEFVVEWPFESPARLSILLHNKQYIHKVVVYNVEDFLVKDEATGYFIVPTNDVASFIMALTQAQSGDKIFLPRGTYDLGDQCLTAITKNNISIIGESKEKTIIKNAPAAPGIGTTATLLIEKNVTNTYLQDLTLFDNYNYYKANDGVGVALQDKGTKTICKNVRLLGYQDTYYSNLQGAVKYFEDCEIHGTVDFICGDGSVYFDGTELVCEQRSTGGGGQDAITASNAAAGDKGYVFNNSTVKYAEGIEGVKPVVSFGRSWNNAPKCIFLNTVLDDSNGELNMYKDASAQKDKISRWHLGAMNALPEKLGEYNSMDKNGNVVTPASNNVTFVLNSNEKTMETILTADEAAVYTKEYTLGDWAATATNDAAQVRKNVSLENGVMSWNASEVGIYLVYIHSVPYCITTDTSIDVTAVNWQELYEKYGMGNLAPTAEYYVRFANGRGGFGPAVYPGQTPESLESIQQSAVSIQKFFRDGQVVIVRDGKEYNVLGAEL